MIVYSCSIQSGGRVFFCTWSPSAAGQCIIGAYYARRGNTEQDDTTTKCFAAMESGKPFSTRRTDGPFPTTTSTVCIGTLKSTSSMNKSSFMIYHPQVIFIMYIPKSAVHNCLELTMCVCIMVASKISIQPHSARSRQFRNSRKKLMATRVPRRSVAQRVAPHRKQAEEDDAVFCKGSHPS